MRYSQYVFQPFLFLFSNACILRYYLSKPLTSLSCSLNAVFPGLDMWDTFACANAIFLTHFIISIAVLENVPPDAGLQKRATFSTLIVGSAVCLNLTSRASMIMIDCAQPFISSLFSGVKLVPDAGGPLPSLLLLSQVLRVQIRDARPGGKHHAQLHRLRNGGNNKWHYNDAVMI
jgi:hypothetical protein